MTRRGDLVRWECRTTFLCYEKLGEFAVKLSTCFWSRLFSVMTWLLLAVEVQFCNFQRGGLEDFTVNIQFPWLWRVNCLLYFIWLLLAFESQFVLFQRRGLADFCTYCWNWFAESRTICTILKPLIGSVPIGEGPGDVAQWRGWTPLSTSVCDSVSVFYSVYLSIIVVFFHSCSEHLISANTIH